jgi:hypothetical protein
VNERRTRCTGSGPFTIDVFAVGDRWDYSKSTYIPFVVLPSQLVSARLSVTALT